MIVWCLPWTEVWSCWRRCHSSYLLGDLMVRPYLVTIGTELALMFGFDFLGDIGLCAENLSSASDNLFSPFAGSWTIPRVAS